MDLLPEYAAHRMSADRTADLHREADAFRLTRVLAQMHAERFPRARRLGAGLAGLARTASPVSSTELRQRRTEPCPC